MSNNSNDPKQDVTVKELLEQSRISVSETGNTAYIFFGKTPKAQLAIDLTVYSTNGIDLFTAKVNELLMIKKIFPAATLEFQSDLIEEKFKSHPNFQWDVLKTED
jgi:hypothetical protein